MSPPDSPSHRPDPTRRPTGWAGAIFAAIAVLYLSLYLVMRMDSRTLGPFRGIDLVIMPRWASNPVFANLYQPVIFIEMKLFHRKITWVEH